MSRHEDPKQLGGIVASGDMSKRLLPKQAKLLLGGLVLVTAACASILVVALQPAPKPKPTQQSQNPASNPLRPENVLKSAQNTAANAKTPAEISDDYTSLGGAYLSTNQPQLAIPAFQKAVAASNGQNLQALIGLSNAYNLTGQKPELVTILQQIIALIQKLNIQVEADPSGSLGRSLPSLQWYTDALKRVQAGGSL